MDALRDLLAQHALFSLGILLLLGYVIGKLANRVRLPEITGYIVAGLLVGESFLGVIPHHMGEGLGLVTEVALGMIALTIGGEFYWVKLKRMGTAVVIVTVAQLVATFVAVSAILILLKMPAPFALLLGAIASATAPAATVAIVQSLRARGTFIDYLYGVVALDDAGAVILFGVVLAIAGSILGDAGAAGAAAIEAGHAAEAGGHGALAIILHSFSEVGLSILLGAVSGFLIHLFALRRSNPNEILITTLGMLFLSTAMAIVFNLSPLLMNMTAGAVIINFSPDNHRIFRILRPLSPPIYALFFVIAGTELRPEVFVDPRILLLGGAYILARAIGKYGGVWAGCRLAGTTPGIRNYLGICMLPQAGVAIGLVLLIEASPAMKALPIEYQPMIATMVNIILLSVFVNELIGPPLSRYAIIKGNEMREDS
ncbi:MAG: cation:proton antiporter [Alkalispirochaeta sp.]